MRQHKTKSKMSVFAECAQIMLWSEIRLNGTPLWMMAAFFIESGVGCVTSRTPENMCPLDSSPLWMKIVFSLDERPPFPLAGASHPSAQPLIDEGVKYGPTEVLGRS